MYAIALFGFRIFDPLPAAHAMVIEQMREGMVVLDARWRVAQPEPRGSSAFWRLRQRAPAEDLAGAPAGLPRRWPTASDQEAQPARDQPGDGPRCPASMRWISPRSRTSAG